MKNVVPRICNYLFAIMCLAPGMALASVQSVTPSPSSFNVSVGNSVTLTVRWNVVRDNANASPTVSSSAGVISIPGYGTIYTVNSTLSQTRTVNGATTSFIFTESVTLPSSVIYTAYKLGFRTFVFQRAFSDCCGAATGTVTLSITGGNAGSFSISRIAMRFDGNSINRVIAAGQRLRASAVINFIGLGNISGQWEIAGPGASSGQPVFRPLGLLRFQLAGGRVELKSPPLPSSISGMYLVRLRLTRPLLNGPSPVIRYYVFRKGSVFRPSANIELQVPANHAPLSADTRFGWSPVENASIYRLEIFEQPKGSPRPLMPLPGAPRIAGILVHADTRHPQTRPGPLVIMRLKTGRPYLWRVQALDRKGRIIGGSLFRSIRKN